MAGSGQQSHPQGVLNRYAARAEELKLAELLTPPGWKAGDPPIHPDTARKLYQDARSRAVEAQAIEDRESEAHLTPEERSEKHKLRALERKYQSVLDCFVWNERVRVYTNSLWENYFNQPWTSMTLPGLFGEVPQHVRTLAAVPGFTQPRTVEEQAYPNRPVHMVLRNELLPATTYCQPRPGPALGQHMVNLNAPFPQNVMGNIYGQFPPMNVAVPVAPSHLFLPQPQQLSSSTAIPVGPQQMIKMNHPSAKSTMRRPNNLALQFIIITPESYPKPNHQDLKFITTTPKSYARSMMCPVKKSPRRTTGYTEQDQAVEDFAVGVQSTSDSSLATANVAESNKTVDIETDRAFVASGAATTSNTPRQSFTPSQDTSPIRRTLLISSGLVQVSHFSCEEDWTIMTGPVSAPAAIYYEDFSTGNPHVAARPTGWMESSTPLTNPEKNSDLMKSGPVHYQTSKTTKNQTSVTEQLVEELPADHSKMATSNASHPSGTTITVMSSPMNSGVVEEPDDGAHVPINLQGNKRSLSPIPGSASKRSHVANEEEPE